MADERGEHELLCQDSDAWLHSQSAIPDPVPCASRSVNRCRSASIALTVAVACALLAFGLCSTRRSALATRELNGGGLGGVCAAGGGFPGVPVGRVAKDILACGKKSLQICCDDKGLNMEVCQPLQHAMIARGTAPYVGPLTCPPPSTPDDLTGKRGGKCTKSESALMADRKQDLDACESELQPLYGLQKKLAQCIHDVGSQMKDLEQERATVIELSKEGKECESKQVEAKCEAQGNAMKNLPTNMHGCPHTDGSIDHWLNESKACMVWKIAEVTVPDITIKIDVPKIDASIDVPAADIWVPEFAAQNFDSNIVIPGGGLKLNAKPNPTGDTKLLLLEERMANVQADVQKCERSNAEFPAAKKQMHTSLLQAQEQKKQMCKSERRLVDDTQTTPTTMIDALQTLRANPLLSCKDSLRAVDALIVDFGIC